MQRAQNGCMKVILKALYRLWEVQNIFQVSEEKYSRILPHMDDERCKEEDCKQDRNFLVRRIVIEASLDWETLVLRFS